MQRAKKTKLKVITNAGMATLYPIHFCCNICFTVPRIGVADVGGMCEQLSK